MPAADLASPHPTLPAEPASKPPQASGGGTIRRVLLVLFLLAVAALVVWKIEANRREADALTAKLDADANQAIPVTVAAVVRSPPNPPRLPRPTASPATRSGTQR